MVTVLKVYFVVITCIVIVYMIRHFIFTFSRLFSRQKMPCRDLFESDLPTISVLIPMHNEEKVLKNVLQSLLQCDYDWDKIEIIPINDSSKDATPHILDEYYSRYPFIRPLHRDSDQRGKPAALNDAMEIAHGEIIIVFDADYRPSRNLLKKLALAFEDPQVGAVMGRVIPVNADTNMLTALLNLERSGGYQVDQQARYNLNLLPQFGGTVGGFRKKLVLESGGFNTKVLAEDTELTYRLFTKGWNVIYDNSAECYEEVPENWKVRGTQVRRWSRGHNAVMLRYIGKLFKAPTRNIWQKLDGLLLLLLYALPFFFGLALLDCLALFFLGEMGIYGGIWVIVFIGAYNAWGNFAPFFEIAAGNLLDGMKNDILVLPLMCFSYYFYLWHISIGFLQALVDVVSQRNVTWAKTERFAKQEKDAMS